MLGLLENIVEVIGNFPGYILYAIETVSNLFFTAIQAVFTAVTTLIPLPSLPVPSYIAEINWFFPVGAVITIMTPLVTGFITWLAIRWVFQKSGNL